MQQVQFLGGSLVLMRDGEQEGDAIGMAEKMMALAGEVGQVEKDSVLKTNSYSFKYVSYEALALAVRQALHKVGLAFFVSTTGSAVDRDLTMSEGVLSFMDTRTGAILSLPWRGQGQDSGDKGGNKALTTGVKYALMRTLLVSEDRDTDGDAEPSRERSQPAPQQQRDNAPMAERPRETPPPARQAPRNQGSVVRAPELVRTSLQMRIDSQVKANRYTNEPAADKMFGSVASRMGEVFVGDPEDSINIEAHQVIKYLFGKTSMKDLTDAECKAILWWTSQKIDDQWVIPDSARQEARRIVASLDAVGQENLGF